MVKRKPKQSGRGKGSRGRSSAGASNESRQETRRQEPRPQEPQRQDLRRHGRGRPSKGRPSGLWLYGSHAVLAALGNPKRQVKQLLVTGEAAKRLEGPLQKLLAARREPVPAASAGGQDLAQVLPEGAVHQGLAAQVAPLDQPDLETVIARIAGREDSGPPENSGPPAVILALDQVTDPQNVGAILRSASAFGVAAVLTTQRHAAVESGALAKAASGALEYVPYVQETNLARSLERLREAEFLTVGLAAEAEMSLAEVERPARILLALGAEGPGLRRLTREGCERLVRLPTRGPIDHLNVSNAAAVSLYELLGRAG